MLPKGSLRLHELDTLFGGMLVTLTASSIGARAIAHGLRRRRSSSLRRVLIIGTESEAQAYLQTLESGLELAHVVGRLSKESGTVRLDDNVLPDDANQLDSLLESLAVDEVVLAGPIQHVDPEQVAQECAARGVTFRQLVHMPSFGIGRYTAAVLRRGEYLLSFESVPHRPLLFGVKRLIDIVGGILGVIVCGVAYLLCAPRIRRESHGSVFFKQTRVGRNGRLFTLYKFRTMCVDAELRLSELLHKNEMKGHIFKMRDDPRVTPFGVTLRRRHIDELPQFWNVLRGDMSLVGTRPPTPAEVCRYATRHRRRLSIKPGITGLWQLQGNAAVPDFEEIVSLDCQYIDNWSILSDLNVLLKTLINQIRGNGW
jgi:exopolysaccharide biosynthesis polyprenyl glycosylphosphotransferase